MSKEVHHTNLNLKIYSNVMKYPNKVT